MIILFDVGNTNIAIGIAKDNQIKEVYRINTQPVVTPDEYFLIFSKFINPSDVKGIAIASVVPDVTTSFKIMAKKLYGINPLIIESGIKTGLFIKTDYPQEVGADLICAAVALDSNEPTIIVDLGTANKYIYVENNTLLGVVISPGIVISMKALVGGTALLPDVEITVPKNVLGTNTIECMQSGITYGLAAEVEGLIERISAELKKSLRIIITGGLSKMITPLLNIKGEVYYNLVLEGLLKIYNKNR
jgi:type III pantothenate kinase